MSKPARSDRLRQKGQTMKTLNLHIGPHKTATTRIQACLGAVQQGLEEHGVAYKTVQQTAKLFRGKLQAAGLGRMTLEEALTDMAPRLAGDEWQQDHTVISFENAVGTSRHVLIPGDGGYSQLDRRLGLLAQVFADREVTVFLALRSYDSFLNSAYSEAVRARFDTLPDALGPFLFTDHIRWPAFVARVQALLPKAKVKIWQHEGYRDAEKTVLAAISGAPEAAFEAEPPEGDYRVSLSRDAVRALLAVHPFTDFKRLKDGAQDMAEAVAQALPVTKTNPRVSLWNAAQTRALKTRYAEDIAALSAQEDLTWVLPPQ